MGITRILSKRAAVVGICIMMVSFLIMPITNVKAAAYSGSGTMTDPYLVQTAEQLQGIRDNLSAHYKLANTIDLAGVKFTPIGRLNQPFTGSLVCELNADHTPKYVIKNLEITVAETAYVSEGTSKWEAALFGATRGATFSGIYVLDASVRNENFGDNQGALVYGNYKPGMDDMNSAILIGEAESTTVMNCGTTGNVNTRSNHCAGLIGMANNSTIENCYSTANVTSEGKWHVGGLIGFAEYTTISYSFATGDVKGSQTGIGSFIGTTREVTVSNSYATGNASGGDESGRKNSFIVQQGGTSATMTNCFALGSIEAATEKVNNPISTTNCWVLSGKLHNTIGFTEGSMEQIKSAFAGVSNWDISGSQPQIITIGVVTDASKYVPDAVQETPAAPGDNSANGTTGTTGDNTTEGTTGDNTTEGTESTEETHASPEQVKALIEALPDAETDGITLDDKEAIKEAWKAYESMSTGDKDEFDTELYKKLSNCHLQVSLLMGKNFVADVKKLPEVDDLTVKDIEKINELWDDYLFLDETLKAELDEDLIAKLEAAHQFAEENEGAVSQQVVEIDTGLTQLELIITIFCLSMFVLIMIFQVIVGISLLKSIRKKAAVTDEKGVV